MQLSVRDIDERTFKRFKATVAEEGKPIGKALNLAMDMYLERKRKRAKLTDLKPIDFGKGTERLSEEIDKIVYGD